MPCDEHLPLTKAGAHEVAGFSQLTFMGNKHPKPAEYALLLKLKDCRVDVSPSMHVAWPEKASDFFGCRMLSLLFHAMQQW